MRSQVLEREPGEMREPPEEGSRRIVTGDHPISAGRGVVVIGAMGREQSGAGAPARKFFGWQCGTDENGTRGERDVTM